MKLLYFAWLKTELGKSEEEIALPEGVNTVEDLLDWLPSRGAPFDKLAPRRKAIRVAVNQEYAKPGDPLRESDEVALFPPVTGG